MRDRAILLVGFAGAFRRSELAGLTLDDIQFTNDGLVITLRHSKTDQEGEGYVKGIPYGSTPATCPVRAARLAGHERPECRAAVPFCLERRAAAAADPAR
jgi:integrase